MIRSFLPVEGHLLAIFMILVSMYFGLWWFFLIFLIAYSIILTVFRQDDVESTELAHGFLSPVNGKVVSIRNNVNHFNLGESLTEIRVLIPFYAETAMRSPFYGTVMERLNHGKKEFFRYQKNVFLDQSEKPYGGKLIKLENKDRQWIGLQFIKSYFGLAAKLWAQPGDIARGGGLFGVFPLGGTVLIFLPQTVSLNIKEGDKLKAAQTKIAD